MREITIKPAWNGWIIQVGCATIVAEDLKGMLSEIEAYINDPKEAEKLYREGMVNKNFSDQPEEVEQPDRQPIVSGQPLGQAKVRAETPA